MLTKFEGADTCFSTISSNFSGVEKAGFQGNLQYEGSALKGKYTQK